MEGIGIVKSIHQDKIWVEICDNEQCKECGLCTSSLSDKNTKKILVKRNGFEVQINNRVKIEVSQMKSITGYVLVFLIPILFLITGYFIGDYFFNPAANSYNEINMEPENPIPESWQSFVFAFVFFAVSIFGLYLLDKYTQISFLITPEITDIVEE